MALGSGMTCFSSGMRGVFRYSVVRAGGMCCMWKSDRKEETETDRQTEERVDVCVDECVSFALQQQACISLLSNIKARQDGIQALTVCGH